MKNVHYPRFILFLIIVLTAFPAFSSPGMKYPVEIVDSLGNRITLKEKPSRIVLAGRATLITANAFYLFEEARKDVAAIGHTDQGLGNFLPYLDKDFNALPQLPHEVGPEQVIANRPDLVIVKDLAYPRLGTALQKLGIPVIALSLESAESFQQDIGILGKALGYPDRARTIQSLFRARTDRLESRLDSLQEKEKPRVLLLYYSVKGGETSFNIAPRNWIQTYQVEAAGGNPVWAESHMGSGWKTVNFEQIAAWDPDFIFVTSYRTPVEEFFTRLADNSRWQQLKAMKAAQVLAFPADFYSWAQPDVRWILGAEWMAQILHPELFEDLNMMDEIRYFYRDMYGLEDDLFRSAVASRLDEIRQ